MVKKARNNFMRQQVDLYLTNQYLYSCRQHVKKYHVCFQQAQLSPTMLNRSANYDFCRLLLSSAKDVYIRASAHVLT